MRGGTGTTTHPPRQQSVRSVRTTVAAGRRCPAGIIQPGHDCPGYNTPSSYTSDGKRLNVGWNSCPKTYRHRHFLNPRFVARAPHGDSLPICARTVSRQAPSADKHRQQTSTVSRQAAWQPHALPRPPCACQPVVETLSELHPDASSSSHVIFDPVFRVFATHFVFCRSSGT